MTAIIQPMRPLVAALIVWAGFSGLTAEPPPAPATPATLAELRERLDTLLSEPRFAAAQWGARIVSLDTGRTLYSHQEEKLFVPASNAKLYTGALALDRLGPDFRVRTSVYADASPGTNGIIEGNLILYGRGDPCLAARFHNGDLDEAFAPLIERLAASGVKEATGDLIADESYFRCSPLGAGWEWDDLQYSYGAEVSALSLNDNTVDVVIKRGGAPRRSGHCIGRPSQLVATGQQWGRNRDRRGQAPRPLRAPSQRERRGPLRPDPRERSGLHREHLRSPSGFVVWHSVSRWAAEARNPGLRLGPHHGLA